jgi:hypothetical protein
MRCGSPPDHTVLTAHHDLGSQIARGLALAPVTSRDRLGSRS